MGRKRAAALPQPADQPQQERGALSNAIREAFGELGLDASTADLKSFINAKHPALVFNDATLSSTSSTLRKKMRGGDTTSKSRAPRAATTSPGKPSLEDLIAVAQAIEQKDGLQEFGKLFDDVQAVANAAGGWDRLAKAMVALRGVESVEQLVKTLEALRAAGFAL